MTVVVICSGGPEQELCSLEAFASREDVVFIGVDRGAYYLLKRGITPIAIVGDFDSLNEDEWRIIAQSVSEIECFQEEKDETDTDLALLRALAYSPSEVILTGVTGGRLDHYEAALRSVYRFFKKFTAIHFKIVNNQNELQFLMPGTHWLQQDLRFRYISFFAYEQDVEAVTLRGVKYETTDEPMAIGSSMFTSNEILEKCASISFRFGICLMIRSID